jgi:hypothetical protein
MDGLGADDQGAHIQHAIERRNNLGNRAPDGEGKIEPQELGHKANYQERIYYTPSSIEALEKERSKLKHILGLEHGNIPIQLDFGETR